MNSVSRRISVGIVGAGEISRKSHLPVLLNMPDVEIAWIYDRHAEAAQRLAHAYGQRAIHTLPPAELPHCDVMLLAIPVNVRGEYLDRVSERGGAALCEKPFSTSASHHRQLIERFPAPALGAGYMRRFFRSTILLRQIVADGMFGPLLGIEVSEGNRFKGMGVDSSFLDDSRLGAARGVLTDLGSHSIDVALYVSGATGFEVRSCTTVMDGDVDRKVMASIQLHTETAGFVPVDLEYCVSWLDRQENRIRLSFQHAQVSCGLGPEAEVQVASHTAHSRSVRLEPQGVGATTYNQAFFLEWTDFLTGLRSGRESVTSARNALLTTTLVEGVADRR